MKLIILCICFFATAFASAPTVVAIFGSRACPWSQQLKEEVWDESAFQGLLKEAGFQAKVDQATGKEPETPILKLLSSQGKEIGYLGYLPVPPEKYVTLFQEMVHIENLANHLQHLNNEQLLTLYRKSCLYNMQTAGEKLLKAGLALDQGPHFLLEHYAKLCKDHPRKAQKIKEEIRKRCPNSASVEWQLATLLSEAKHERGEELKAVVKPLEKFLHKFAHADLDLTWRCHLLLSEYYQEQNDSEQAKIHREKAIAGAPAEVKAMWGHE
jgi:hypothetical protein